MKNRISQLAVMISRMGLTLDDKGNYTSPQFEELVSLLNALKFDEIKEAHNLPKLISDPMLFIRVLLRLSNFRLVYFYLPKYVTMLEVNRLIEFTSVDELLDVNKFSYGYFETLEPWLNSIRERYLSENHIFPKLRLLLEFHAFNHIDFNGITFPPRPYIQLAQFYLLYFTPEPIRHQLFFEFADSWIRLLIVQFCNDWKQLYTYRLLYADVNATYKIQNKIGEETTIGS
ncbi:MAG: hypothetical protein OEZ01_06950 [Candidatus Heimdallarchaeota archaeon]|nr:hypothetical protein [Candidatus Heimdallarchaeota archaeon]MDH5645728.1 hypothetical protein [Candidatus Heimdallarchaeota archaeon]